MTRRFALHFAFATNMSKSASDSEVRKWKPEGLDLSAGPVPVFPIIYILFTETRELQHLRKHFFANLAVPTTCVVLNLQYSASLRSPFPSSSERRCSSRTFRYGYLVTT